ncbi:amidase domain-containing protein [Mesobacillus jeotgali]|uniref:amidase domain-containing protein n=1 Tax=Mesobacillus jeotgali TaxID=129985 RepID=UPI0009A5AC49|nr:amidase domain-containing protein [Mesobacillus jeotgali]
MRDQLQELLEQRVLQCVSMPRNQLHECPGIELKKQSFANRSAEIVKAKADGRIKNKFEDAENASVLYDVNFQYLIKQKGLFYMEEEVEKRRAEFYKGVLVKDEKLSEIEPAETIEESMPVFSHEDVAQDRKGFRYDRLKAVQYAERWWNDYNPSFKKFEVDCTNYISQCLHAGGAPMRGYPNRSNGWWMQSNNWSFSWSVANAMRWHIPGSKLGLRGREVTIPEKLKLGDVICYDFEGDGRFDHTTIVTGHDADGMPLVNAHTYNCRMRYWAYKDSTAYTPNIKYKFFTITDDGDD